MIADVGSGVVPTIFDVTSTCGEIIGAQMTREQIFQLPNEPCPYYDIRDHAQVYMEPVRYSSIPQLNPQGDEIMLYSFPLLGNERRVVLRTGQESKKITYLALGDSYSSGEGDSERQDGASFYKKYDGIGSISGNLTNSCHVSSRSYPFVVSQKLGLSPGEMKSVACSGAEVLPDMITTSEVVVGYIETPLF